MGLANCPVCAGPTYGHLGVQTCKNCGYKFFGKTISFDSALGSGKITFEGMDQCGNPISQVVSFPHTPPPSFICQFDEETKYTPHPDLSGWKQSDVLQAVEAKLNSKTAKPAPMQSGAPDDFQTDPSILDCLVPYLNKEWWIWECACGKGQLVKGLRDRGFRAFGTDLYGPDGSEQGRDFLGWVPSLGDAIVTNPPYSKKEAFLDRALMLGKPFAFLMRDSIFDSKERRKILKALGKDFGMVIPPKRPTFTTPVIGKKGGSWFACYWICGWLDLPSQIVFPEE